MAENNYIKLYQEGYSWFTDAMWELHEMADSFEYTGQRSTANAIRLILAKFKIAGDKYRESSDAAFREEMRRVDESHKATQDFVMEILKVATEKGKEGAEGDILNL